MIYFITYNIQDTQAEINFLNEMRSCGDSNQVLQKAYFLKSEQGKDDLYAKLKPFLNPNDLFIIINCDIDNMAGWVNSTTVDWLFDNKSNQ